MKENKVYNPKFEWAHGDENSTVFTCTMQLPTLSELQELTANVNINEADLKAYHDHMLDEWKHGAAVSYFQKEVNMGRLIGGVKSATLCDTNTLMCWLNIRSSKLHKQFSNSETAKVNKHRLMNHITNCARLLHPDPSDPNAPVPADATLSTTRSGDD